jgi:hypothetical protein
MRFITAPARDNTGKNIYLQKITAPEYRTINNEYE